MSPCAWQAGNLHSNALLVLRLDASISSALWRACMAQVMFVTHSEQHDMSPCAWQAGDLHSNALLVLRLDAIGFSALCRACIAQVAFAL